MERCLICLEDFLIKDLCADVEGSRGVLLDGCKHFYCVECVKKFPIEHRKCSLCNLKMVRLIYHQCQKCQWGWGLFVEAGGSGEFKFTIFDEGFCYHESKLIVYGGKTNPRINQECLANELSKLPCFKKKERLQEEIAEWLGLDAQWYPLFEGQENPDIDPFICISQGLIKIRGAQINMIVVAKREDTNIDNDLYFPLQTRVFFDKGYLVPMSPYEDLCEYIDGRCGFPDGRMIVACEDFIHRMGWEIKHNEEDSDEEEEDEEDEEEEDEEEEDEQNGDEEDEQNSDEEEHWQEDWITYPEEMWG